MSTRAAVQTGIGTCISVDAGIRDSGDFPDEAQEAARAQIEKFKGSFSVHEETGVAGAAA